MKHTPGPWRMATEDATFVYALNPAGSNRFSVHVQPGHIDGSERTSKAEREATARLIAAAPAMLEALNAVIQDVASDPKRGAIGHDIRITGLTLQQIRAAIAKAEGRS